ncbi:MAG: hypothetical protein ACN6RK_14750, partial [Stenotrophomonas sp.]
MTTDNTSHPSQPKISSLNFRRLICAAALALASLPALAQNADTAPAAKPAAAKAEAPRSKTDSAATATLAALLPHLAASDTIPLMDRSAMFAGDLSRL